MWVFSLSARVVVESVVESESKETETERVA